MVSKQQQTAERINTAHSERTGGSSLGLEDGKLSLLDTALGTKWQGLHCKCFLVPERPHREGGGMHKTSLFTTNFAPLKSERRGRAQSWWQVRRPDTEMKGRKVPFHPKESDQGQVTLLSECTSKHGRGRLACSPHQTTQHWIRCAWQENMERKGKKKQFLNSLNSLKTVKNSQQDVWISNADFGSFNAKS